MNSKQSTVEVELLNITDETKTDKTKKTNKTKKTDKTIKTDKTTTNRNKKQINSSLTPYTGPIWVRTTINK